MKKLFIALLLLLSSNVLYAQGRGVPSNMKNKIWNAMQEDMRKRQQKQERQHESTVRNAQAAQRSDRQIRETREDAAFLNDYYQPDNYISGPNYDDMSDFSSAHRNTNNSERMSMLENDGEELVMTNDLIERSQRIFDDVLSRNYNAMELLNHPQANVRMLFEGDNLEDNLKKLYGDVYGVSIDDILKKPIGERTAEENEVVAHYKNFIEEAEKSTDILLNNELQEYAQSEEKKCLDMAILSMDTYGDDVTLRAATDYTIVKTEECEDVNDPITHLSQAVDMLNEKGKNKLNGFHATLYYNKETNEYTVACNGTEGLLDPDALTDLLNGLGVNTRQYESARALGNLINNELKDYKINITGHSLGGGLASVIGLMTGRPTYTFNSAGVTDKLLKDYGVIEKFKNKEFNITNYTSNTDLLTLGQKTATRLKNSVNLRIGLNSHTVMPEAIGNERSLGFAGFHKILPVVEKLYNDSTVQKQYETTRSNMIRTKLAFKSVRDKMN